MRVKPNEKPAASLEQYAKARSRRAFLTLGVGAVAAGGAWAWLRSRPEEDGESWPLRRVLRGNERVAEAYFGDNRLARTLPESQVEPKTRLNGDVGLGGDFNPARWSLAVYGLNKGVARTFSLAQICQLPRVDQVTQLNCIEGWTVVVHWTGARFSDFTETYFPEARGARYIGMRTPDEKYFVGLDSASAMHPQTLLCYEMNGSPLTAEHGAPLRLAIPVKYGIKSIKRIGSIDYTGDHPEDYWANEGYDWYAGL